MPQQLPRGEMMLLRDHKENSQLYWWPLVKGLEIPLPRTRVVPAQGRYRGDLEKAAEEIGYPLFLRSDFTSLKHSWNETALVQDAEELWTHSNAIELDSLFQGLPCDAWILRELLDLEAGFTAFRGMPVHKEQRFFLRDGRVQCRHAYWPASAFKGQGVKDLEKKLALLGRLSYEDSKVLAEQAAVVAKAVSGYWSADFAKSRDGKWYLLDMAVGEDSFHMEGCKFKGEDEEGK